MERRPIPPRRPWAAALFSCVSLVLALSIPPASPAGAAVLAPTQLRADAVSRTAVALSWKAVPGAASYRVAWSASADFARARYQEAAAARLELSGLRSATRYWVKVSALSDQGARITAYSKAVQLSTAAASGYAWLPPTGLVLRGRSVNSLDLAWTAPPSAGLQYRVRYAVRADLKDAVTKRFTGTSGTITGLAAARTYYLQVRVVDAAGTRLSQYSATLQASTAAAPTTAPAPSGLAPVSRATTGLAVSWRPVSGAASYQVRYVAAGRSRTALSGTEYAELTGLAVDTKYSISVRVTDASGTAIGPYGAAVSVSTRSKGDQRLLSPVGLNAAQVGATALRTTWTQRGGAGGYRLAIAASSDMAGARYVETGDATLVVSGLAAGTRYWVKVRALDGAGRGISQYSPAASAATATRDLPLVVGSFNVRCAECVTTPSANEQPWPVRVKAVAAAITGQAPDVLGVQEASQARLHDKDGSLTKVSQFEDLVKKLGGSYRIANPARYNCVSASTTYKCVAKDQGASKGTKIIYNSATVTIVRQGSLLLSQASGSKERYLAWAVVHHIASGKDVMFANVHLEHTGDTGRSTTFHDLRIKQARESLAEIARRNPAGLPVVLVGDLNSTKWSTPANGPYDALVAGGLIDPLGNGYQSRRPADTATVEKRIRTEYASINHFNLIAPKAGVINGTYMDYIFTSPIIRTLEWETVVDIDANDRFVGVIPSDHNMVRATLLLP